MSKYLQGRFSPRNPQKYRGDVRKIFYRSSWELSYMLRLDNDSNVTEWSSEETLVPYRSIDGKVHRYFVDFKVRYTNGETFLVEIKPLNQVEKPKEPKRKTKTYMNRVATWVKNQQKWQAAREYATDRGMKFLLLTEKELGIPPG